MDPALPEAERNLYTFSYDWRQDIRTSGRQLGEAIERWHVLHDGAPAWIIGHSMGGITARWYIEKEGGKDFVERLFLLASPWNGSPKAMHSLFQGLDLFLRARFDVKKIREQTRHTIASFPSSYQILPHEGSFLRNAAGKEFDPYTHTGWLENDDQRALLEDAIRFNRELGNNLSVETLCLFGRKRPTVSRELPTSTTAACGEVSAGTPRRWETARSPRPAQFTPMHRGKYPSSPPMAASSRFRRCWNFSDGSCGIASWPAPARDDPSRATTCR